MPLFFSVLLSTRTKYIPLSNLDKSIEVTSLYTTSKLIGQYSGNAVPKDIYTSSGSVTVREVSDATLNYSGFVIDWQCYTKQPNDAGVVEIRNKNIDFKGT